MSMSAPLTDQLGADVAWGVASIRLQYGLVAPGTAAVAAGAAGTVSMDTTFLLSLAEMAKQPAALRSFAALMRRCVA